MDTANQNHFKPSYIWDSKAVSAALNHSILTQFSAHSVSIDSRTISADSIFIGIKGENYNGNLFALDALKKGAALCILDEQVPGLDSFADKVIIVDDALRALKQLAVYSRNRTKAKIIAITGSVGKTSVKEMLRMALANQGETYASVGNFNNHFGLPLSLANMPEDIEYGIFELGMNHIGEILELTEIARPNVAIITTVDAVHLEFFSSISAIAEAKAEIFAGMKAGDYAIINYDNPYHLILADKARAHGLEVISFGTSSKFDYILEDLKLTENGVNVTIDAKGKIIKYELPAHGRHQALNSLAVLAAIDYAGADIEFAAKKGLINFTLQKRRGEIKYNHKLDVTVIDDTYNASPASVNAALENLGNMKGRKVVVLGDMKELGTHSKELHIDLQHAILREGIDKVLCVGELMQYLYDALPEAYRGCITKNSESMSKSIVPFIKAGDIILVKGSRSMQMEKVVDAIEAQ